MNKIKKNFLCLMVIIFLFLSFSYAMEHDVKEVLIIHSYSEDYKWTDDFNKGILNRILNSKVPINYHVEYLDTKSNPSEEYYERIKKFIKYKYKNKKFDLIITIDNAALDLVLKSNEDIFQNIPIIAGGVNNAEKYDLNKDLYIIAEDIDYVKTMKFMKKLNPELETIYIINDYTRTGKAIRGEIENELVETPLENINIKFISEKESLNDIGEFTKNLGKKEGILYLVYFLDGENKSFNYKEALNYLNKRSSVPIFTVWDFYLNEGTIGGNLTSPKIHGEIVGDMSIDYLLGKKIIHYKDNLYLKDKKVLDYEIYEKNLSYFEKDIKGVNWINKPESYFSKNKKLIIPFLGIILMLIVFLLFLLDHIKNQEKINEKDKKMLNMQRELIYTLGDVIETRSGETGNHVKRVSKISEFLAKVSGYENLAEEILITSPLHDLGKIGISDKVLKKTGKLTEEEYDEIKKHTNIGYELLKDTPSEMLNVASVIAYQHQEQWDGGGYPNHLREEEISIYARIVAVADVYDALRSARVYKEAWPLEKVIKYFREEKGKKFQPSLVEALLKNIAEVEKIRMEADK